MTLARAKNFFAAHGDYAAVIVLSITVYLVHQTCGSPLMVVATGSMEPSLYQGDIILVLRHDEPYKIGEIVVFSLPNKTVPIVHRVISVKSAPNPGLLTKGDANPVDDRVLYSDATGWLRPEAVLGRVRGVVPRIGYPLTIIGVNMNEHPFMVIALVFLVATAEKVCAYKKLSLWGLIKVKPHSANAS